MKALYNNDSCCCKRQYEWIKSKEGKTGKGFYTY